MDQQAEKDRKSNRTRQKNKRGEASKVEWNDSPEIPDRAETSDLPSLPLGSPRQYEAQLASVLGRTIFFNVNAVSHDQPRTHSETFPQCKCPRPSIFPCPDTLSNTCYLVRDLCNGARSRTWRTSASIYQERADTFTSCDLDQTWIRGSTSLSPQTHCLSPMEWFQTGC